MSEIKLKQAYAVKKYTPIAEERMRQIELYGRLPKAEPWLHIAAVKILDGQDQYTVYAIFVWNTREAIYYGRLADDQRQYMMEEIMTNVKELLDKDYRYKPLPYAQDNKKPLKGNGGQNLAILNQFLFKS